MESRRRPGAAGSRAAGGWRRERPASTATYPNAGLDQVRPVLCHSLCSDGGERREQAVSQPAGSDAAVKRPSRIRAAVAYRTPTSTYRRYSIMKSTSSTVTDLMLKFQPSKTHYRHTKVLIYASCAILHYASLLQFVSQLAGIKTKPGLQNDMLPGRTITEQIHTDSSL